MGPMPSQARLDPRRVAVAAAGFSVFLNLYAAQSLLPTLVRELRASPETAGWTVGGVTLAIALSSPLAGVLVGRMRRRAVLGASFAGLLLATLGCAASPDLPTLIACRFAQGLCLPPVMALTMSYIGEAWPASEVGQVMAFYVSCNVVGGFLGRFMAGLAAAWCGWRSAFLALAALNALAAWAVLRAMPEGRPAAPAQGGEAGLGGHLRTPRMRVAFTAGFTVLFSLTALFTYVTYYLAAPPFNLGPAELGALFVVYLVGVVITPLAGQRIRPGTYGRVLATSSAVGAGGALLTLLPSLPAVLAGLAVSSSSVFVSQSAASGYVSETAGAGRSSALGLYLAFYYLGGSAGATLPGLFWSRAGWSGTLALILAVNLATMVLARRLETAHEAALPGL